jgi:hypothetical protein
MARFRIISGGDRFFAIKKVPSIFASDSRLKEPG